MKTTIAIFLAVASLSAFAGNKRIIPRNSSVKVVFTTAHKYCFVTYAKNSAEMAIAQDAIDQSGNLQEISLQLDHNSGSFTVRNLFALQKSSCEGSIYVNDELVESFELKAEGKNKSDAELAYTIS